MLDCIVYVSSVANPRKHARKVECLEAFAAGAKTSGATSHVEWNYRYVPSRLAVMLGWATTNTGGPNIALRKQIISEQQRRGYKTMCIDASCFKYIDKESQYLRYSLGGPFYDRAEYANHGSSQDKWQEIKTALKLDLKPGSSNPSGHILICMQRDGGFAMKTLDPLNWLAKKIESLRQHTARQIVIRPHPGQYNMADFDKYRSYSRVSVINPEHSSLTDSLKAAHSVVLFNSSAAVAAVLAGIPVFVDDASCVAWNVANKDIARIETPNVYERDQWLYDLSAAHWSDQESRSGVIWQKFLPYL